MFDMNNKSNWKSVLSRLKAHMGVVDESGLHNDFSDGAFQKKVINTIENASSQYRSLTGARYKGPDFDRIYQEDKLRLQHTEELIEKMLIARPLSYNPKVFHNWNSDNKVNILLRAQSARFTPLCAGNQNVFHVFAAQSGLYWLSEWYKHRHCMTNHSTAYWLNQLSDTGQTPLQLFWDETLNLLNLKKECKGMFSLGENFDGVGCATILVLENDWSILDPESPKSIACHWNNIKSDPEAHAFWPDMFEAIQAVITHKTLKDVLNETSTQSYTPRKI